MYRDLLKKSAAAGLAALTLFTVCACSGGGGGSEVTSGGPVSSESVTGSTAPETTAAPRDKSDLPETKDLGGWKFRVLNIEADSTKVSWTLFIPEEQNGETLNDAVYDRNLKATEKYNFTMETVVNTNVMTAVRNNVQAGDDQFETAIIVTPTAAKQISSGFFLDLNTVPNLDLDKNYWDRDMLESISIGGKAYILNGDLLFCDDDYYTMTMYNRALADDLKLDNMYDIAYAGGFTYDVMIANMKKVVADLNGDGKIDIPTYRTGTYETLNDRIGMMMFYNNAIAPYFAASGVSLFEKDKDDKPVLVKDTAKAAKVFDKVQGMLAEYSADWKYFAQQIPMIVSLIDNKQVLFQNMVISQVRRFFRDITVDFGLLPVAKYDEAQETYGTSGFTGESIVIPATCKALENTGFVLEAIGSTSYDVNTAYYKTCLESKYTRDEESIDMIRLATERIVFDLAFFYDFAKLGTTLNEASWKGEGSFASTYASLETAVGAEITKFLADLKLG